MLFCSAGSSCSSSGRPPITPFPNRSRKWKNWVWIALCCILVVTTFEFANIVQSLVTDARISFKRHQFLQPADQLQLYRFHCAGGPGAGLFLFITGAVPAGRVSDPGACHRIVYHHRLYWSAAADLYPEHRNGGTGYFRAGMAAGLFC